MSTLNVSFAATQTMTWTIANLGSSTTAGRECTAVDNTTSKCDDFIVSIQVTITNAAPANDKTVYVYAGEWDAVNGWQGGLTGSDAAYTFADITTTPSPLRLAGAFYQIAATTQSFVIPSITAVFGGTPPQKWGLAMINYAGQVLKGGTAAYTPVTYTIA